MTQPDLFASSPRPKKAGRVVATSVIAGQAVNRDARIGYVTEKLRYYGDCDDLTSAELAAFDAGVRPGDMPTLADLLYFRRGLSDALALGLVEHAGQRKCAVSGRACVTWRLRQR